MARTVSPASRWIGGCTFAALTLWAPSALAQTPEASAAARILALAQTGFEAMPEAERRAIQTDLIWTGHLNSAASGGYGPLTFRAVNAFKAGRGTADGLLTPAERRALAQQAQAARDAAGFRIIDDTRTGARLGVPTAMLPKAEATPAGGSRWQSADGKVTLDVSATAPGEGLAAIFERATAATPNNPGRKITYKLLRPDFFVVAGETATGKFYRRLAAGPQGLRGFSIGYEKALAATVDKLVIAIASSFEPFPTGPAPARPSSAIASVAGPAPSVASPVQRPSERHGVALALSDKVAFTAASAIEGCRLLRVADRPARPRLKDDASSLVALDLDGGGAMQAPGLRAEPVSEGESLVLTAFGEEAGKRVAVVLPGQGVRGATGVAVSAPLQPGQAGSLVFDRQGRLAGLVTGNPSDKVLIAGVAPQRAYGIADAPAVQGFLGRAGLAMPQAEAGATLSTGAVFGKVGGAALPVVCTL